MNFLVDAQLPPALARWSAERGHQAAHVYDVSFHTANDPTIWQRAEADHSVMITKDEDFVDRWLLSDRPLPRLDSQGQLLKPRFAGLAGAALARYCQAVGTG